MCNALKGCGGDNNMNINDHFGKGTYGLALTVSPLMTSKEEEKLETATFIWHKSVGKTQTGLLFKTVPLKHALLQKSQIKLPLLSDLGLAIYKVVSKSDFCYSFSLTPNPLHFPRDLTPTGDRISTILEGKKCSFFFKPLYSSRTVILIEVGCETTNNCWCFTKMTLSGRRENKICIQNHPEILWRRFSQ